VEEVKQPVRLRLAAQQELEKAIRWYEEQDVETAKRFADDVIRLLVLIGQMPQAFALSGHRDVRRAVLKRYPYLIYYVERLGQVEVLTIVDGRRNPSAITRRVNQELRKPTDPA